ncbi:semaphorin-5A-like [Manis javanica]|uniref:semaphorin-5A-like n=1 Tax=Manis javanica TaxID=9974 RepID=UPI003C6D1037
MVGQGLYANLMERNLQDAQKFILMHEVQPVTPVPHFMEDNSCFSHVAMDVVQGRDMLIHIIYLATAPPSDMQEHLNLRPGQERDGL